jgi:hypothetical protein
MLITTDSLMVFFGISKQELLGEIYHCDMESGDQCIGDFLGGVKQELFKKFSKH